MSLFVISCSSFCFGLSISRLSLVPVFLSSTIFLWGPVLLSVISGIVMLIMVGWGGGGGIIKVFFLSLIISPVNVSRF